MSDYVFDSNDCWYNQVCNLYETDECYPGCLRYMEMFYLFKNSFIPKAKQYPTILKPEDCDYEAFIALRDIKEDILNFVKNGEHLYIHSQNYGNGKTTWAFKIMQSFFDKQWDGNGFKPQGVYVHVPTYMNKSRDNIGEKDEKFILLKKLLLEVPLAIFDDIAACVMKDFDHIQFLSVIDARINQGLSNIYTGNLNEVQIFKELGGRLASRVYNESTVIELFGADRRGEFND